MTKPATDEMVALVESLRADNDTCPFCLRDPYEYVDIGVGYQRVAVTCCDAGIALIQYEDKVLAKVVERMRAAADAFDAAEQRASSDVKVKDIVWGETSYGRPEAETVVGVYRIVEAWDGGWSVNVRNEVLRHPDGRKSFATLDEAKAAAQADYRSRILSAIQNGGGDA
ncbi:hypothetical protein NGM99_13990 [Mesorhizobium sp. RP14(2022)]|uniref:Restriction alleviation protein Lar n=1 Tax=Mesorhizobium liriopis TaxID=2953882 RepID=A0ABT1C7T7_9HYPH|nr:hypothetical protein [Mesorhizobium liriopis]MCO6050891.1 hypothetical protein [Mesorhizobium liriopis]